MVVIGEIWGILPLWMLLLCTSYLSSAMEFEANQTAVLLVDASRESARKMPDGMFGIFFEEINHAGAGGLWAELVSNRGFEAGGPETPSNIDPWSTIGNESNIILSTDRSSCFVRNKVALRMQVFCDDSGDFSCPAGGVGVYNPGYWGMYIEEGKKYKVIMFVMSKCTVNILVSLKSSDGLTYLAGDTIRAEASKMSDWTKVELILESEGTNTNSRLEITTTKQGVYWFDQVSVMPMDTYKDILDGIEFARGDSQSKWGSVRTTMGHPEPFHLNFIAVGNQDCFKQNYRGNYIKFHSLIKASYPDIKIISNCDASSHELDHPADLYDIHVYASASDMFSRVHQFDRLKRTGPKAFVSEYAVTGRDAGRGSLLAALAEAGFLIGLETNSDVVEMASCAPLFVNDNDRRFNPDAIVFNSWQNYGTPTYWMQHFFKESNGAIFHPSSLLTSSDYSLAASVITWQGAEDDNAYLRLKIVNFGNSVINIKVLVAGLQTIISSFGSKHTLLTSESFMDENSFGEPTKIVPVTSMLLNAGTNMDVILHPYSLTSMDLLLDSTSYSDM